jgi:hypothetical protein
VTCQNCGKELTSKWQVKYCSRDCMWEYQRKSRAEAKAKRWTRICEQCGKEFVMHSTSGKANRGEVKEGRFCSRKCHFTWVRQQSKKAVTTRKNGPYRGSCSICGKVFESRHKRARCSRECDLEYGRRETFKSNSAKKVLEQRPCRECGKMFVPEYGNKRRHYCSDACSRRQGRRNAKHTRRTRGKAVKGATVYRARIYERDGWKCQICGKKVNRLLDGSHPMAASLDHIIPLSKGGRHEPSNVRLAHRKCNTAKADRSGPNGDQLLLFG